MESQDFSVRGSASHHRRTRAAAREPDSPLGGPPLTDVVSDTWLSALRALDEPGELGSAVGLEFPSDFDRAATQTRFDQLAEGLSEAFGCPLSGGQGPQQDAARFGIIRIPAEITHTHDPRTGTRLPLAVILSNFGDLITCLPSRVGPVPDPGRRLPAHQEDHRRVEQVAADLRLRFVPVHILDAPYEGANQWVFGPDEVSWLRRFFDHL